MEVRDTNTKFSLRALFVVVTATIFIVIGLVKLGLFESSAWPAIELKDARISTPYSFTVTAENEFPNMLYFRLTGNVDGTASVKTHHDDGRPIKTVFGPGTVQEEWACEFYKESAEVIYAPNTVKQGNLKLEYLFQ